jgi:hypothetical protein
MPAWYAARREVKEWTRSGVRVQYACGHQCRKAPVERPLPLPLPVDALCKDAVILTCFKISAGSCFQYKNPEATRKDIYNVTQQYKGLVPKFEPFGKCFYFSFTVDLFVCSLVQRFPNFFQVGTTFILQTPLLLSPLKANCLRFSTTVCDTQFTLIWFFLSFFFLTNVQSKRTTRAEPEDHSLGNAVLVYLFISVRRWKVIIVWKRY